MTIDTFLPSWDFGGGLPFSPFFTPQNPAMTIDFLLPLRDFVGELPMLVQWLGVILLSAIPFVESYLGSAAGVLGGVPAPIAFASAVIGNAASMIGFVLAAGAARRRVLAGRAVKQPSSPRRERVQRMLERFGVPVVSLVGQTILPSQIVSGIMVSLGAKQSWVITWQLVSIILWGALFTAIAALGLTQLLPTG